MTHPHAEDHKMRRLLSLALTALIAAVILPGPVQADPGVPASVTFTAAPAAAVKGVTFAVGVQVLDDTPVGVDGVDVTLTLTGGPGALTCDAFTVTTAGGGFATFSGCSIDTAGIGDVLTATVVGTSVSRASSSFPVVGPATQLVATTQPPATATVGSTLATAFSIEDSVGNVVTTDSSTVTVALTPSGTLGGTTTKPAVFGVATFSDLSIGQAGTYRLTATAGALTSLPTSPITVSPGPVGPPVGVDTLVVLYPSLSAAGASHSLTVTAHTSAGAVDTGYRGTVHFTSTDAQAVLPADYTFTGADAGSHAFSATLKTVGSQSITVTDAVATATVAVTVSKAGAVVASPDVVSVAPVVPSAISVLANDSPSGSDPGQPVSITGVTQPKYGHVSVVGSTVVYDPRGCFVSGGTTDLFTYTISDGLTSSTTAVVVTVVKPGQAVTAPAAATLSPNPVTDTPSVALTTGILGSTVPVRVAWCGVVATSLRSTSPYSLRQSSDAGVTFPLVYGGTAASTTRGLALSHAYSWKAQTTDSSGRTGASAATAPMRALLVQDSQTGSVKYVGTWSVSKSTRFSGGSERYSSRTSASASYTVVGARGFAIVSSTGIGRGSVKVYVDGKLVATVSERATSTLYKRIVYARALSYGSTTSHTIKLVPSGTGRVDLDALLTLR